MQIQEEQPEIVGSMNNGQIEVNPEAVYKKPEAPPPKEEPLKEVPKKKEPKLMDDENKKPNEETDKEMDGIVADLLDNFSLFRDIKAIALKHKLELKEKDIEISKLQDQLTETENGSVEHQKKGKDTENGLNAKLREKDKEIAAQKKIVVEKERELKALKKQVKEALFNDEEE